MTRPEGSASTPSAPHAKDARTEEEIDEMLTGLARAGPQRLVPVLAVVPALVTIASIVALFALPRISSMRTSARGATIGALLIVCAGTAILLRNHRVLMRSNLSRTEGTTKDSDRPEAS
jgi:hypothetical protein